MHIESVPNRNSRPAILLRESYREDGKVRKRTLANLTRWPEHLVEGLRTLLRGGVAMAEDALSIERSLPHGHVAAILGIARALGLPELLTERLGGAAGRRCRDLVLAMLVDRLIAPSSKLATVRALNPDTAASSLGEVLGLGVVQEREVYAALDWLLAQQERIERTLARRHLGDDVSSSCLEGRKCELAPVRPQPRSPQGQAANRLRPVVQPRRLPDRHPGVRRQHRRSGHARRPGDQGQAALRSRAGRLRRRPWPRHLGAYPRGPAAGRAGLDHHAARAFHPAACRRRAAAAVAVRRA